MVVAFLVSLLLASDIKADVKADVNLTEYEQQLMDCCNLERVAAGLPMLRIDPVLQDFARKHCSWMAQNGQLQHTSANVAENIARGQRTPKEVVRDWMNSPGHRANILNPQHHWLGTAGYVSGNGTIYWIQDFR